MARSSKKGLFFPTFFFKQSQDANVLYNRFCRAVKVPAEFIENRISVYNGKTFSKIQGSALLLGQRFGEFVPTRAIYVPKKKKSAKKKSAKKKSAKKK
jgi:ribosomal protein S19